MTNIYAKMLRGASLRMTVEEMIMTAKRILCGQILSVGAVALLLGWGTTPAVFAEEPLPDRSPGAEAPGAEALDAQAGNLRSDGPSAQHLVAETLGTSANAFDAWAVQCPSGTHHIHYDVGDFSAGGPTLGIVATDFDSGFGSVRRAPQGGISPAGQQNGGAGFYVLYVFKTGGSTSIATGYDSIQVCHTATHQLRPEVQHFIFQD
jgi:hypothetical protein